MSQSQNSYRTHINSITSAWNIDPQSGTILLGSCFTDEIGAKLRENKFLLNTNPFGTLFSPLAINKVLDLAISDKGFDSEQIIERDGYLVHYDAHSRINAETEQQLLDKLLTLSAELLDSIRKSSYLVITWGTAFTYQEINSKKWVANCHKQPGHLFEKILLSTGQIVQSTNQVLDKILSINPNIKLILTVSPVRHTKDTIPLNSVSKSTLRLAAHELASNRKDIEYFPSFEIMMDDLRDYRFYKSDMIHPSELAINHIWEIFKETFLSQQTAKILKKWNRIQKFLGHRPNNPGSPTYKKQLLNILEQLKELSTDIDTSAEIEETEKLIELC